MLKALALIFTVFFLAYCSSPNKKSLKISVNSWIGYAPLFYVHDKGWLKEYQINVVNVVSLAESMYIYGAKNADAFTGTQYEYKVMKKEDKELIPLIMFDTSFGGDMILGNRSIETLQKNSEKIDSYLELDSINSILLEDFITYYSINPNKINYINKDQETISYLKNSKTLPPSIIVTYSPYDLKLKKQGFKELASTKDGLSITVVDGLYTTQQTYLEHKEQFKILKEKIDKAIEVLQNDPKEFYAHVKHYLGEMSYEEFKATLQDIKWINRSIPPNLVKKLNNMDYQTNGLI